LRATADRLSRDFDQELTRLYAAFLAEPFRPEPSGPSFVDQPDRATRRATICRSSGVQPGTSSGRRRYPVPGGPLRWSWVARST
jgi:hypothetical protein